MHQLLNYSNMTVVLFKGCFNKLLSCTSQSIGTFTISTIGFVGLGAMGNGMARNLLKHFKEVVVYDVNKSAADRLEKAGAKVAASLETLSQMDCVITMLPASQHVRDVYQGPRGLISQVRPGTLLIDSSTVDPNVAKQLASEAERRQAVFVDAPVSGGILAAASGKLTFMVGGCERGVAASEQVLRHMGTHIVACGPSGSGQVAKICNNLLLGISMIATAEALNLGIRLGMEPKCLTDVINNSSGRCWSSDSYNPVPGVMQHVPASNHYQGGFLSRLIVKDLSLAVAAAQSSDTATPLARQALHLYQAVCDDGKADLDFAIVYQYIKNLESKD